MNRYAYMIAAVLALGVTTGSAQAGGSWGSCGGDDGFDNGVQLNGIPVSGSDIETVELPDRIVAVGKRAGGADEVPEGAIAAGKLGGAGSGLD